jgi:hypothetical protein
MRSGRFKSVDAPDSVGDSIKASTGESVDKVGFVNIKAGVAQTNRVSPKKLLLSKWTAGHPERKEKHFLMARVGKARASQRETAQEADDATCTYL